MKSVESKSMSKDLLDFFHSVRREAIDMDNKSISEGKLIKYIFEINKDEKNSLAFLYSDSYLNKEEALSKVGLNNDGEIDIVTRGPFPLFDGALSDSKINRWKIEREMSIKDKEILRNKIELAKENGFKYVYCKILNEYNVDRILHFEMSEKSLSSSRVNAMLNSSSIFCRIDRINVNDGEVKSYEKLKI